MLMLSSLPNSEAEPEKALIKKEQEKKKQPNDTCVSLAGAAK